MELIFFLSLAVQPFGPWPLFSFLVLYTAGRAPRTGGSARRKAATYKTTQIQNKCTQAYMPRL
jgi:hypothetical protein